MTRRRPFAERHFARSPQPVQTERRLAYLMRNFPLASVLPPRIATNN
jgi:hypothetical protein